MPLTFPRHTALPLALALTACVVPPYDATGKRCDDAHPCPSNLSCIVGVCGRPCAAPTTCSGPARPCVMTLAGTDGPGFVDGPPAQARFRRPSQLVAVDGALIVADTGNHALRRIPLDGGAVTTLAGNGTCHDADPHSLCEPFGLSRGPGTSLFVTNLLSNSVSRVDGAQVERVLGDGFPNTFVKPLGVAFAGGKLIATRTNYCELTFFEPDGTRARTDAGTNITLGGCGPLDTQTLNYLEVVAVSPDERTLYFGDWETLFSVPLTNGLPSGPARVLAGGDRGFRDGTLMTAQFDSLSQLTATTEALYVTDSANRRLRKVALGGTVTTLAGTGARGITDGPATGSNAALLSEPGGIAVVGDVVYFTTRDDHRVRKLEGGQVSTVAGAEPAPLVDGCAERVRLASPGGLDVDPRTGTLYFTDTLHHAVRALGTDGIVTTLVGGVPGARDGDFTSARLNAPSAIRVLPDGTLLVADTDNGTLVQLDLSARTLTTLVGSPRTLGTTRVGCNAVLRNPPRAADLCAPRGLTIASSGEVYFTDTANPGQGFLWKLNANHTQVSELVNAYFYPHGLALAANGDILVAETEKDLVIPYDAQGIPKSEAAGADDCSHDQHWERRCFPHDVAFRGGELLVLFTGTSTVSRIPPVGNPVVLAGHPFKTGLVDGTEQTLFDGPRAMTALPDGGVLIADTNNQRLRLLLP